MQAGQYLEATRGMGAPEVRICYDRAESLCHSLNRPLLLYSALIGQWRYTLMTERLSAAMEVAQRIYSLGQEQENPVQMIWPYNALAATNYFLGHFESARQYATHALEIWRSRSDQSCPEYPENVGAQVVGCLCYKAHSEWQLGEAASCHANMDRAISLAKELKDMHILALALHWAAILALNERNVAEVDRLASEITELSARHKFESWLALGAIHRGWARSVSGDTAEGIPWIEQGIRDLRATGTVLGLAGYLTLKAEALHLADRTSEALEAINEAQALAERFEHRVSLGGLHRLRGVFLAALGADETQIEASFQGAIRIAKEQKSVWQEKRAEATYAEYRDKKPRLLGAYGLRPEKISVARLPVTGSDLFGREEDIALLDDAWANQQVNVVTIAAWGGVGKSTLVNHWLRRMATEKYRSAELVFGWSFYRQGTSGGTSSADEFIDAALTWFGDPDPRLGTAWEKGERLAKLVAHRPTLLVLDGLEPLQNPPGPQEGRLREPSLQALLREVAAFNRGLCVITTRTPVADIADHERTSAVRRDLEQLSSDAGASLLRALGVKGDEAELRSASDEFSGHCLALTLLGSYLTDAYHGDIHRRDEVSARLAHDLRQGAHARKVMESYQTWLGEGPELAILRMLGLFDRPADEQSFAVLLKSPAIPGLTESLTDLRPAEWQTILAKLRRARLLAQEDPHNPGQLDTHPLVREHFGEQLRSQRTEAWKECNRRLFNYYRALAPELPDSFRDMEPLFLAVICGCNSGLYHKALNEVYIPRIQRGDTFFAAKVLGARGALLSALIHFFEHGRWGSLEQMDIEGQALTAEDRLFILMQAGLYLTTTRGFAAPEALACYERAESLCVSLNQPLVLFSALRGLWRYFVTNKLSATMQIAKRVHSLAQDQKDSALMIGAYRALAVTLFYLGDFESARQYAMRGVQIWRSGGVQSPVEEITAPAVSCLFHESLCEWHFGEIASCHPTMAEAIALAKELNDMPALAVALWAATILAQCERDTAKVERLASDLIELATRQNIAQFLGGGEVLRGWARSACGDAAEGLAWIERGIEDWMATGAKLGVSYYLVLKAEASYFADRVSEALDAITEAQGAVERSEERWWCAELHRLRGVFLTAIGADETQIEASFSAAISTAQKQKSVSLEKRAEATYAEYLRQKASGPGGREFRLPLL
jgi:predicted ATPase